MNIAMILRFLRTSTHAQLTQYAADVVTDADDAAERGETERVEFFSTVAEAAVEMGCEGDWHTARVNTRTALRRARAVRRNPAA